MPFALAALSALALTTPGSGAVQTAAPARPVAAAPAAPPRIVRGVSPAAVIAWLTTQGATPGAVQQDGGRTFVRVGTDGLSWLLFFQSCDATGLCSDLQFSTGAASPAITPDLINTWNRDRRFLKAIYEAPKGTNPASAVVQYDVLLNGDGAEQLADPLAVWRSLLPEFARLTQVPATPTAGQ
jgi:hypothetical protein